LWRFPWLPNSQQVAVRRHGSSVPDLWGLWVRPTVINWASAATNFSTISVMRVTSEIGGGLTVDAATWAVGSSSGDLLIVLSWPDGNSHGFCVAWQPTDKPHLLTVHLRLSWLPSPETGGRALSRLATARMRQRCTAHGWLMTGHCAQFAVSFNCACSCREVRGSCLNPCK